MRRILTYLTLAPPSCSLRNDILADSAAYCHNEMNWLKTNAPVFPRWASFFYLTNVIPSESFERCYNLKQTHAVALNGNLTEEENFVSFQYENELAETWTSTETGYPSLSVLSLLCCCCSGSFIAAVWETLLISLWKAQHSQTILLENLSQKPNKKQTWILWEGCTFWVTAALKELLFGSQLFSTSTYPPQQERFLLSTIHCVTT